MYFSSGKEEKLPRRVGSGSNMIGRILVLLSVAVSEEPAAHVARLFSSSLKGAADSKNTKSASKLIDEAVSTLKT